jgi:hypothetical protein
MNAPPPGNPLWHEHVERLRGLSRPRLPCQTGPQPSISDLEAQAAGRGEWTAAAPGRLGKRLLADIEPYLEFFAIVRS